MQLNNYLDEDATWSVILSDTSSAVRSTYHTMLQTTPDQLGLGHDMILNTLFVAEWEAICKHK